MAGNIRVTAQNLRSKAEELKNLNSQFRNTATQLEESEETLHGMWEGEAHDAFHNAFHRDRTQMDNFWRAIEEYVQRLVATAARYEQTEASNVAIGTERKY